MKRITLCLLLVVSAFALNAQDFSIPIEANGGYINFNENSRFKDTWYVGGATGFDFTDNAGIRGYYWKALDDGQIDEFDKLEIYGAESKVKIPITKQVKPYLVVGGGLLKPYGDYTGEDGSAVTEDQFFGSAGGGLDLNFIRFLSVTGYARAMVSDFNQLNDLGQEDNDISASWNYGASINFNIGDNGFKKKTNSNAENIVMPAPKNNEIDVQKEVDQKLEKKANEDKIRELEERIEQLEEDKRRAEEREQLKKELREELMLEYDFERRMNKKEYTPIEKMEEAEPQEEDSKKKMTKLSKLKERNDELEQSIEDLTNKMTALEEKNAKAEEAKKDTIIELQQEVARLEDEKKITSQTDPNSQQIGKIEQSIGALNNKIDALEHNESEYSSQREIADLEKEIVRLQDEKGAISVDRNKEYEIEMARLEQQLELQNQLNELKVGREELEKEQKDAEVKLLDREFLLATKESLSRKEFKSFLTDTEVGDGDRMKDRLFYTHTNGFLGAGFGKDSYSEALLGVKPNFFIAGSQFRFVPEASVGLGDETSVNVLANALYDFSPESVSLKPYVGVGGGFIMPNGNFKPAINIALGSQFENIANGKLSAEIAGRNFFKYNQVSVGYEIF